MANEPGFILNESEGGMNWGYCQQKKNNQNDKVLVKYTAEVETSTRPRSGTR